MEQARLGKQMTDQDAANARAFVGRVLDDFKAGRIAREAAAGGLWQVIAALDAGDIHEARRWFEEGGERGQAGHP